MNKLVVVGNGMAGVGCVEQILKHAVVCPLHAWKVDLTTGSVRNQPGNPHFNRPGFIAQPYFRRGMK
jgi:nitrite reductase/ring-hydroxylating ferredoxin subunit